MNIGAPPPVGEKSPGGGQRPRGRHIEHACNPCRRRKGKCNGERPTCLACRTLGTTEACTWDGPDRRRGCASEISALQERVTALEAALHPLAGAVQALVRQFGSIDNVLQLLQNTTNITVSSTGGQTQGPPSGSTPGVPDSAGNNPSRLPSAVPPSQPTNGGGVYLNVPSTWHRQRSASTSSSDSGFASEAPSMASSSSGHNSAASTRGLQNPKLSVAIPGGFDQASPTPAPASTPSSGVPASAANNLSPSYFNRQPDPQSGAALNPPVQQGWNHQRTPATPSSGSSFSSWASISAPSSTGQALTMPVRSPQNPMLSPQYPMFSPTIPNVANQVPPSPTPQQTRSPDPHNSSAGFPSSPRFPLPPQFESRGGIYFPPPMPLWDPQSGTSMPQSESTFAAEAPSMTLSTGQHVEVAGPSGWPAAHTTVTELAHQHITMTVESPDEPSTGQQVNMHDATVHATVPNAPFADEDDFFGGYGNFQGSENGSYGDSTQYPIWNGQV